MPKKKGNNEGSIRKRKDGTWEARVTTGKNPDGSPKRASYYGKTRSEVAAKMAEALNEVNKGTYIEPARITVTQWLDIWLWEYKQFSVKEKTFDGYLYMVEKYIKPSIGGNGIKDLRADHVQKELNKLHKKGLGRTVEYYRRVLFMALEQAVSNGILASNVCRTVKPPQKRVKKKQRVLTPEEQNLFIQRALDHRLGAAFILDLATGLRRGELLALSWDDFDFENHILKITKNLVRINIYNDENRKIGSKLQLGSVKTKSGVREIPLLEPIEKIMLQHKEKQEAEIKKAGDLYIENNLVFCTELGLPIEPRNLTRTFYDLIKGSGIAHTNLHGLRHTFATRGLENGIELKVMQELLGHANINITADIYTHVLLEKKKESIKKLNGLFHQLG